MNKRTYRISKYFALIFLLLLTGCTARTAQTPALTEVPTLQAACETWIRTTTSGDAAYFNYIMANVTPTRTESADRMDVDVLYRTPAPDSLRGSALTDECHVANVLDAYLPAEARALGDVVVVAESPDGRTTARFLCSRAEGVILAVEITAAKGADAK